MKIYILSICLESHLEFYDFFKNSGWQIKFLDDFYFLAPNYIDDKILKKNEININLNYLCDLNYTKRFNYVQKKNIIFFW